ncbi:homoserine kinase [Methylophilaceae bacterium]|nr:homoserine kinase [Methylophilaceae bacterium]MDB4858527.1 homoserine kinase [Alphaproteobacteria bacterium]MDC1173318.1 homoserine kinase [Methylophilaceae bacterium]|tara:strand:+ start:3978 stop:4901 length:924 start_codon:yes stop_codon:yes gene_type:complete
MAVYTSINKSELEDWLKNFSIGTLKNFKGISSGVTNTNYFVETDTTKLILTIFEENKLEELPFYLDLMRFLASKNFPCPLPVINNNNEHLTLIKDKPAVLVSFLLGAEKESITEDDCCSVGEALARLHTSAKDFSGKKKNSRNIDWISTKFNELKKRLSSSDQTIIEQEIDYQKNCLTDGLPSGIIHGDLFRDNVFFHQEKLSAFIDFYYACNDHLILDIAITINDWCSNSDGSLKKEKFDLFLNGYQSIRMLQNSELKYLNNALRLAALRFWLSRLDAYYNILESESVSIKDPNYFKKVLLNRQNE